jgi:hypothetical protein
MNRTIRKLVLDLTPLIDMIIILMFGVMIYATELSRTAEAEAGTALAETEERSRYLAKNKEELLERLRESEQRLNDVLVQQGIKEQELQKLRQRLESERLAVATALAKLSELLGAGLDAKKLKEILEQEDLSQAGARRVLKTLQEAEKDPASALKELRRVQEMEKAFTFVDLHLDKDEFLHISINGRKVGRFLMHDRSVQEIKNLLKEQLNPRDYSQIILFLFSTEGKARGFMVDRVQTAIKEQIDEFSRRTDLTAKQFRYAFIGIIDHLPPTINREG